MRYVFAGRTGHDLWPTLRQYRYAHRGLHDKSIKVPENSLLAFKKAAEAGYGAELDVHLLKDGSLMVFHDALLERMTGAKGVIEDLTLEEAKKLRLLDTECDIPTFDEVLSVFENKQPLIIELKAEQGNHKELTEKVLKRLDSYKGLFCIESFDPRVIIDVKKMRPQICRGQLAMNFRKDRGKLPKIVAKVLTGLMLDVVSKPDFVAYKFEDRNDGSFKRAKKRGVQGVTWTIRTYEDMMTTEKEGNIAIFEQFVPETKSVLK